MQRHVAGRGAAHGAPPRPDDEIGHAGEDGLDEVADLRRVVGAVGLQEDDGAGARGRGRAGAGQARVAVAAARLTQQRRAGGADELRAAVAAIRCRRTAYGRAGRGRGAPPGAPAGPRPRRAWARRCSSLAPMKCWTPRFRAYLGLAVLAAGLGGLALSGDLLVHATRFTAFYVLAGAGFALLATAATSLPLRGAIVAAVVLRLTLPAGDAEPQRRLSPLRVGRARAAGRRQSLQVPALRACARPRQLLRPRPRSTTTS